jgi:transposase InsO family protein
VSSKLPLVHVNMHCQAVDGPNQKWVADFTYIWTAEGWLYVAVVIDLFSRRVVGCSPLGRLRRNRLSGNG